MNVLKDILLLGLLYKVLYMFFLISFKLLYWSCWLAFYVPLWLCFILPVKIVIGLLRAVF